MKQARDDHGEKNIVMSCSDNSKNDELWDVALVLRTVTTAPSHFHSTKTVTTAHDLDGDEKVESHLYEVRPLRLNVAAWFHDMYVELVNVSPLERIPERALNRTWTFPFHELPTMCQQIANASIPQIVEHRIRPIRSLKHVARLSTRWFGSTDGLAMNSRLYEVRSSV